MYSVVKAFRGSTAAAEDLKRGNYIFKSTPHQVRSGLGRLGFHGDAASQLGDSWRTTVRVTSW